MIAPPVPAHESAWERGLRQAKEMRRRSSKRRETDVEYEEKKELRGERWKLRGVRW